MTSPRPWKAARLLLRNQRCRRDALHQARQQRRDHGPRPAV